MKCVTIVDYSAGNLYSLIRAIHVLGGTTRIGNEARDIADADFLILPGDGAFGDGMKVLRNKKLIPALHAYLKSKRPFLGICLGMQILFEESEEFGHHRGLGFFPGKVVRLFQQTSLSLKLPHIGWNQVFYNRKSRILQGIRQNEHMYFLHSYTVVPKQKAITLAETTYEEETFCSMIEYKSTFGCQFHPETSDVPGMRVIKNFLSI